jgi:hypothetical protein
MATQTLTADDTDGTDFHGPNWASPSNNLFKALLLTINRDRILLKCLARNPSPMRDRECLR